MAWVHARQRALFRFFIALLLCSAVLANAVPDGAARSSQSLHVSVTAPCAVVMGARRGPVLYAKSPHLTRPPASTVKVLTALVVLDHLPLQTQVRASARAASRERVTIGMRAGERFIAKDLLRALLISSANDAATALAEAAAGSETRFADLMTRKARALGARHSRFRNASGLPAKGQYSSPYDLVLIMDAARRSPFISETLRQRYASIRSREGRKILLRNHNKMLWREPGSVIGKTGWTRRARHCFVGYVRVGKRDYLLAFLGSQNIWRDVTKLLAALRAAATGKPSAGGTRSDGAAMRANRRTLTSKKVLTVQKRLAEKGFSPGPTDGIFGPRTLSAVRAFQKSSGLEADGIVGPKTWKALEDPGGAE